METEEEDSGPHPAGLPALLVLADSPGQGSSLWAFLVLAAGILLALSGAYLQAALSRVSRPKLLQRIQEEEKKRKAEAFLADPEEPAALAAFVKLLGIAGILVGFLCLDGNTTVGLVLWGIVILLLSLFLLEILPLAVSRRNPEAPILRALPLLAPAGALLSPLLRPFLKARVVTLRALGLPPGENLPAQGLAEEILAAVEDQESPKHLDADEREWIENIVDFKDMTASAVMTPRTDMVCLEVQTPLAEALASATKEGHSRLPVYKERLDVIVGIFYVKDILPHVLSRRDFLEEVPLEKLMRKPYFIPETKKIPDLLREFRARRLHMAIVLDEYGGTAGLVTIEDILEEIVGEIEDEFDSGEEEAFRILEEGKRADVDARAHVREVNEILGTEIPEDEDFETIGGFVCSTLGRIPSKDETFERDGLRFKVLEAGERSVGKLRIEVMEKEPEHRDHTD